MSQGRRMGGFSLLEVMVGMAIMLVLLGGVLGVFVQNSRINKSQKLTAEVQANARACLSLVVQKLRSAGWDPMNAGIPALALDPDPTDGIDQIEVFADLDMDGTTAGPKEQILIRHRDGVVEWRDNAAASFTVLATQITNDADGDGVIEPMFVPDSPIDPTRVTVRVTAASPMVDPATHRVIRQTVASDVVLRKRLERP